MCPLVVRLSSTEVDINETLQLMVLFCFFLAVYCIVSNSDVE